MADPVTGDFAGRVAIVTGAARGLGRAAAARLHERGARVAVNVRDAARAEQVAREIGERARPVSGDVAAPDGPDAIVRKTLEMFGRIDILVNNAALPLTTRFEQITPDEWRRAIEVNLTAPFLLIQAALPTMKAQGYGRIVNISSTAGRMVSTLGGAHYTSSKTGLLGLTRAAAKELGRYGITVNAVCPGLVDTPLLGAEAKTALDAAGFALIDPDAIAAAVEQCMTGDATGQAYVCQAGREPTPYRFSGVPGPASHQRPPAALADPNVL
jgi:NAD(P)-dependent dehydrogenase (short-subunit alcohol dehydrogenase family)